MKFVLQFLTLALLSACSESGVKQKADSASPAIGAAGICPVCHSANDVIPIVYGLPTRAAFQKADSGLIYLGGCDADKGFSYFCKKDSLEF